MSNPAFYFVSFKSGVGGCLTNAIVNMAKATMIHRDNIYGRYAISIVFYNDRNSVDIFYDTQANAEKALTELEERFVAK
jgi:hypothetical protein